MIDVPGEDHAIIHIRLSRDLFELGAIFAVARDEKFHIVRQMRQGAYHVFDTTRKHKPRCGEEIHIAVLFAIFIFQFPQCLPFDLC